MRQQHALGESGGPRGVDEHREVEVEARFAGRPDVVSERALETHGIAQSRLACTGNDVATEFRRQCSILSPGSNATTTIAVPLTARIDPR